MNKSIEDKVRAMTMLMRHCDAEKPCKRCEDAATEIITSTHNSAVEQALALINKHDPSTDRATSKAYWGNTLRTAIAALKLKENNE